MNIFNFMVIYVLVVLAIIFDVRNKFKKNRIAIINGKNTVIFAMTGGLIGVLLPKPSLDESNLPLVIVLLLLSYLLALPVTGFHRYYLIRKMDR